MFTKIALIESHFVQKSHLGQGIIDNLWVDEFYSKINELKYRKLK